MLIKSLKRHYAQLQEDGLGEFLEVVTKGYALLAVLVNLYAIMTLYFSGLNWNTIAHKVLMLSGTMVAIYMVLRFLLVAILVLLYAWGHMVEDRRSREIVTFREIASKELNFDGGGRSDRT